MKILGIESSATAASAAVFCDGRLLSMQFTNTGLTHSQTLMPMIEGALSGAGVTVGELDYIASAVGPGSFTGVRIGVATAKGLAFSNDIKCVAVSSLLAIAKPFEASGCYVISLMDARCKQFYTASFLSDGNTLERLTPDEAISLDELKKRLLNFGEKGIIFAGDGARLAYDMLKTEISGIFLAPASVRYQTAGSVCEVAYDALCKEGESAAISPSLLVPSYLRLSQAERELKLKKS